MLARIVFFILCFLVSFFVQAQNFVAYHGQLSVQGNRIVNKHGDVVSFAGPSLFWSNNNWGGEKFYNDMVVSWVAQDWNAPIIRAAMGVEDSGGYISSPESNLARVKAVIDAAIENGMYVIVDWHSHKAENYTNQARDFFSEIAREYGSYPNIIYEIYNEPLSVSWEHTIKPYARTIISEIRSYDKNNIIVVGTPNWCQDIGDAANSPITGYSNIAYSVHFYAGTHKKWLRDRVETALKKGIAVIITEWGTVNANGDGGVDYQSTEQWLTFMRKHQLIHCNWALNDKREGASILKQGAYRYGYWTDDDLTESGLYVYSIIKNWNGNTVDVPSISESKPVHMYTKQSGELSITIDAVFSHAVLSVYTLQGQLLQTPKQISATYSEFSFDIATSYVVFVSLDGVVYSQIISNLR